ncbi:MAG: DUF2339 domain-containing protein [Gammaproteobacteria bacterium]|nr:DUF2339 domain-containing protein [Gammaproteobacteria bacterium]
MNHLVIAIFLAVVLAAYGGAAAGGFGFLCGIGFGLLLGLQLRTHDRLRRLELQLEQAPAPDECADERHPPSPAAAQSLGSVALKAVAISAAARDGDDAPRAASVLRRQDHPRAPGIIERALVWLKRYMSTGNVVAKVGVLMLFVGVSFLLKYAVERNALSIELRLAGTALGALALLVGGWRTALPARGLRIDPAGCGSRNSLRHDIRGGTPLPGAAAGIDPAAVARTGGTFRISRGGAGLARACHAGHRRWLPGADTDLDRQRQSCRAVQLLRPAQSRHRRHCLVQGLANPELGRVHVHLRDRRSLGLPVLYAGTFCQHRAVPDPVVPVLSRGFGTVCAASSTASARLRGRHPCVRAAAGVPRAAGSAGARYRFRTRVERTRDGVGLSRGGTLVVEPQHSAYADADRVAAGARSGGAEPGNSVRLRRAHHGDGLGAGGCRTRVDRDSPATGSGACLRFAAATRGRCGVPGDSFARWRRRNHGAERTLPRQPVHRAGRIAGELSAVGCTQNATCRGTSAEHRVAGMGCALVAWRGQPRNRAAYRAAIRNRRAAAVPFAECGGAGASRGTSRLAARNPRNPVVAASLCIAGAFTVPRQRRCRSACRIALAGVVVRCGDSVPGAAARRANPRGFRTGRGPCIAVVERIAARVLGPGLVDRHRHAARRQLGIRCMGRGAGADAGADIAPRGSCEVAAAALSHPVYRQCAIAGGRRGAGVGARRLPARR